MKQAEGRWHQAPELEVCAQKQVRAEAEDLVEDRRRELPGVGPRRDFDGL